MKRLLLFSAAVAVAVTVSIATQRWWLPLPGEWLDVSGPVESADVIFIFSGQSLWRAKKAAQLYRQQLAPRVVFAAGNESELLLFVTGERIMDTEIIRRMLVRLGVPHEVITPIGGVTSTVQDADVFARYVRAQGVRSAIVVTSHLHSRRARWALRRALQDDFFRLQVVEASQPDVVASEWWRREDGVVTVFNEYLKFGYYLLHY